MILVVAGTRPEIIKLAPVYAALRKARLEPEWLFTGQQADLARPTFGVFDMIPEYEYTLTRPKGTLTELNALLANVMQEALDDLNPQMVIVQGDTLSAAVGAQQAFLGGVKVGHVEAGLRSWDVMSPFPEEASRVWIDAVADYKFAPTAQAATTLSGNVYVTGNTGIDALAMVKRTRPRKGSYAVVTLHRRENALSVRNICQAVKQLAQDRVFDYIVWPVHPNPIVRDVVPKYMKNIRNVELIEPLPYDEMVNLVRNSRMLLTDSGGLQEEALALDVPCLVMRAETERPEGIAAGGARLVDRDRNKIVGWAKWIMSDQSEWDAMAQAPNPYGDGKAAERIAAVCKAVLGNQCVKPEVANWDGAHA